MQQGWEVRHVAEDIDVSGAQKLEDRPGMAQILEMLPSADFVIAAKLDRFARSVLEFSRLMAAAEAAGTVLITADGTLSPGTSKLVVHVLAACAEFEREQIAARIRAGQEHRRRIGRWVGGPAPYGYRLVKRDGGTYLAIDSEAAAIVRECAAEILEKGRTLASLARELNERGVLSRADRARQREGRPIRAPFLANAGNGGFLHLHPLTCHNASAE